MLEGLDDDANEIFKGGTLEITQDNFKSRSLENLNVSEQPERSKIWGINPIIGLPKRISNTIWSCKETGDDKIATTQVIPILSSESPSDFFTFRDGVLERAIKECTDILVTDNDRPVLGTYLLTEISLWDTEKERLVIITMNNIFSIKYDFIALRQIEYRKIPLDSIDCIVSGQLVYPPTSLVPRLNGLASGLSDAFKGKFLRQPAIDDMFIPRNRSSRGVRLMWNKGQPVTFKQKWNPFTSEIPFLTFTSHPLYLHSESFGENSRSTCLEEFLTCVIKAIEDNHIASNVTPCLIEHKEILLPNYVGFGSLIHNRNNLGFFKVRGKFSF